MVKIYTKTGDQGETSLISGKRVEKSDERINLYGDLDELNSWLGCLISHMESEKKGDSQVGILHSIQNNIFNLGSLLACEHTHRQQYKLPLLKDDLVTMMEKEIDKMTATLPVLKEFILPGGTLSASYGHVARTRSRQVERLLVGFFKNFPAEEVEGAVQFLNRLSDYLFTLARYLNKSSGVPEKTWEKD